MRKFYFIYILLFLTCTFTFAQKHLTAENVLDTTADIFKHEGGVSAWFRATNYQNGVEQGHIEGNMRIKGNKYRLSTPELTTWFDGNTQWTYITANEEVNISEPTEEEREQMNPYAFINLYKKGYQLNMTSTTLQSIPCYEITLTAKKKETNIPSAIITINKKDFVPMSIQLQQHDTGNWSRISIFNFSKEKESKESDFKFDASSYPNAEIIDLR
jgi:hypothetical protein